MNFSGDIPSVSLENNILKSAPKNLDDSQLSQMFGAKPMQFPAIDLQSKLATLYSAAVQAADNFQPDGPSSSPKRTTMASSDLINEVPHSAAGIL